METLQKIIYAFLLAVIISNIQTECLPVKVDDAGDIEDIKKPSLDTRGSYSDDNYEESIGSRIGYSGSDYSKGNYPKGGSSRGGYANDEGYLKPDYPRGGYEKGGYPKGDYPEDDYPRRGGYRRDEYPEEGYSRGGYRRRGFLGRLLGDDDYYEGRSRGGLRGFGTFGRVFQDLAGTGEAVLHAGASTILGLAKGLF